MGFYFQEPELLQYLMRNFHIQPWSLALISFPTTGSKIKLRIEPSYPTIKTYFTTMKMTMKMKRKCWPQLQTNSCFTIPSQERHFCLFHQSQRLPQLLRNKQFILYNNGVQKFQNILGCQKKSKNFLRMTENSKKIVSVSKKIPKYFLECPQSSKIFLKVS